MSFTPMSSTRGICCRCLLTLPPILILTQGKPKANPRTELAALTQPELLQVFGFGVSGPVPGKQRVRSSQDEFSTGWNDDQAALGGALQAQHRMDTSVKGMMGAARRKPFQDTGEGCQACKACSTM